jgi:arginase family enzyme
MLPAAGTSGDCPAARGAVAGLQRRYRDLAVVWLDAHGDFNTPAITISGYLGGMALAMLAGRPDSSRIRWGCARWRHRHRAR